jgi:hypothetical protein
MQRRVCRRERELGIRDSDNRQLDISASSRVGGDPLLLPERTEQPAVRLMLTACGAAGLITIRKSWFFGVGVNTVDGQLLIELQPVV